MALLVTGQKVELREILLKNKPAHMLELSPKGTVPVLLKPDGRVLEESLDIMKWVVEVNPSAHLNVPGAEELALIDRNDNEFKRWLDRYKYQVGCPEHPMEYYRNKAMVFLSELDQRLITYKTSLFESGDFADIAILPFCSSVAFVDKPWFDQQGFEYLHDWLNTWLDTDLFKLAMTKFPVWSADKQGVIFPEQIQEQPLA